jgi:hypothetical protein
LRLCYFDFRFLFLLLICSSLTCLNAFIRLAIHEPNEDWLWLCYCDFRFLFLLLICCSLTCLDNFIRLAIHEPYEAQSRLCYFDFQFLFLLLICCSLNAVCDWYEIDSKEIRMGGKKRQESRINSWSYVSNEFDGSDCPRCPWSRSKQVNPLSFFLFFSW